MLPAGHEGAFSENLTVTLHRAVAAYLCQASELRKVSISIPILREIRKAVVRLAVQL